MLIASFTTTTNQCLQHRLIIILQTYAYRALYIAAHTVFSDYLVMQLTTYLHQLANSKFMLKA